MSLLCGWLSADDNQQNVSPIPAMLRALRVHAGQAESIWQSGNLTVGLLELPEAVPMETAYAPAVSADGRFWLWMAGEAFDGGGWIELAD
ncbi:MAG: hypothetical protein JNK38_18795, partial [Acidobacteria bacterium]|nr:hypothetical protein [Acidobacteriota bacterium]